MRFLKPRNRLNFFFFIDNHKHMYIYILTQRTDDNNHTELTIILPQRRAKYKHIKQQSANSVLLNASSSSELSPIHNESPIYWSIHMDFVCADFSFNACLSLMHFCVAIFSSLEAKLFLYVLCRVKYLSSLLITI